jgi:DNA polymerase-3 subunit gamma/tau
MFENIIEQGAVLQLNDDIINRRLAPSMLFFGPPDTGKGSTALELARTLSCEADGVWKCSCPSCQRHRYLEHDDLLVLGRRSFAAEIKACQSAFLRNPSNQGAKLVFFRSFRKLLLRFSPVLMEDDPKSGKIAAVLHSLDEKLNEFWSGTQDDEAALAKICDSLVKDAFALESEGISGIITIGHIRSASYWCRLAPNGKQKTLIMENAENMRDEGRNSLLKLLEEPPATVSIVLTAQRREVIMPTILSRLRPYRFLKRSAKGDKEVIRRVFHDEGSAVSGYLNSFMPQSTEKLETLAAWFLVSLARIVSLSIKKIDPGQIPAIIYTLGERYAPIAEAAGLERCIKSANVIKILLSQCGNFKDDSFSRFMKICLDMVSEVKRSAPDPQNNIYNDIFRKYIGEAVTAVDVLNINPTIALESLFYKLKRGLSLRGIYA